MDSFRATFISSLLFSFANFQVVFSNPSTDEAYPGISKNLRCYTCNLEGFPACDDPFQIENGRLAACQMNRTDGRPELCAKIVGTVIAVSSSGETSDGEPSSSYSTNIMNATSEAILSGRNFSLSKNFSFLPQDYFFGRSCFPVGDGWVWREEPYNETFILGDLTIQGSVYICRNTRCNGVQTLRESTMLIFTLTVIAFIMTFVRDLHPCLLSSLSLVL